MTAYVRVSSPRGKVAHLAPGETLIPLCPAGNLTGPLLGTADDSLPLCRNCEKTAASIPQSSLPQPSLRQEQPEAGTQSGTGHDPDPAGVVPGPAATQTPAGGEPAAAARPSSPPDRTIQELQAALDAYNATHGLGRDPGPIEISPARPRFARPWWLRLGRKGGGE